MPSKMKADQCRFSYNESLGRTELSIDGSQTIASEDQVTLVVFSNLSRYLGFSTSPRTFCFGAPGGKVIEQQIAERSHALARFKSGLKEVPKKYHLFLDIVAEQVSFFCSICLVMLVTLYSFLIFHGFFLSLVRGSEYAAIAGYSDKTSSAKCRFVC